MIMGKKCLGQILSLHRGYDLTHNEMKGGDIPVAGSSSVIGFHDVSKSNGPVNITIGRSGSVGKTNIYYGPIWPHNTSLYVDDYKGNDEHYIYYLLKLINLEFLATSSVVPSLDRKTVYPMKVPFIEGKNKQQKLVSVLQTIDRKISLNSKANEILEKMAKQLYDYWFVQFDFPDENGKPYKSSGGKMVYNKTLKREIPEGWDAKNINEISKSVRGVTYDRNDLADDGVLVLRGNNIQNNHLVYDANTAYIPDSLVGEQQKIRKGDIIMTMSSGSKEHIGKCMMFNYDSEHTFGAFLNCFRPKKELQYYFFVSLISERFKATIKRMCGGTGINNLTNQSFDEIYIPIPNDRILQSFESFAKDIFDKYGQNESESLRLTSLRDFLLPMLMNGQVTIKDEQP